MIEKFIDIKLSIIANAPDSLFMSNGITTVYEAIDDISQHYQGNDDGK